MYDPDQYNDEVKAWGDNLPSQLRAKGTGYGIAHRSDSPSTGSSLAKLGVGYKQRDGLISIVSIRVNRSLIYTHKGAGKGFGGVKGSRWIDKFGNRKSTNPASKGKAGSGSRREKPFINDTLDGPQGVTKLADIVAENLATNIVNSAIIK